MGKFIGGKFDEQVVRECGINTIYFKGESRGKRGSGIIESACPEVGLSMSFCFKIFFRSKR